MLQIVFVHSNHIKFIDSIIELLCVNGKVLIGDIPNIVWNKLEKNLIDDGIIFSILSRYRNMGCETYLLEQNDNLPLNKTREDILIKKLY